MPRIWIFASLPAFIFGGMNCGNGVNLCGLLTLESGFGTGNYGHDEPVVHGLWPEVCYFPFFFSLNLI